MSAPPNNSPQTTTISWEPQYATPVHANPPKFRTAHSLAAASTGYVDVSSSQWSPSSSVGPRRMVPNIIARCPPSSSMLIPPPGTAIPTPLAVRSFNHPMRNSVYAEQMAPARKKSPLAPPDAKVATYTRTGMIFSPDLDQPGSLSPPLAPGALSPSVVLQHGLQAWVSPPQGSVDFSDTLNRVREMGAITALRSPGETSLEITQSNSPYHSAGVSLPMRPNLRYNGSNFLMENPDIHIVPLNKRRIFYCNVKHIVLTMVENTESCPNALKIRVEHGGFSCLWNPASHCELTIPLEVTANLYWTVLAGDSQTAPQCIDVPCMLINNVGITSYSVKPPTGDAKISFTLSFSPNNSSLITEFVLPETSSLHESNPSHNQSPSTPAPIMSQNLATKVVKYRIPSAVSGGVESPHQTPASASGHEALKLDSIGCLSALTTPLPANQDPSQPASQDSPQPASQDPPQPASQDPPQPANPDVITVSAPSIEEISELQVPILGEAQLSHSVLPSSEEKRVKSETARTEEPSSVQTTDAVGTNNFTASVEESQDFAEGTKRTDLPSRASEVKISLSVVDDPSAELSIINTASSAAAPIPEDVRCSEDVAPETNAATKIQITILPSEEVSDVQPLHTRECEEGAGDPIVALPEELTPAVGANGTSVSPPDIEVLDEAANSLSHATHSGNKSVDVDSGAFIGVEVINSTAISCEEDSTSRREGTTCVTGEVVERTEVSQCSELECHIQSPIDIAPGPLSVSIVEDFEAGPTPAEIFRESASSVCPPTIVRVSQDEEDTKESNRNNVKDNLCIEAECEISSMEPLSSIAEDVVGEKEPRQSEQFEVAKVECENDHLCRISTDITPSEDVSLKSIDPLASSDEEEHRNSVQFIPRQDFANEEVQRGTPSGECTVIGNEGEEGTEDKIVDSNPADSESSSVVLTDDESLVGSTVKDAPEFAPEEDEEDAEEFKKILFKKRSSRIIQVTGLGIPEETIEHALVLQEGIAQAPVKRQLKAVQAEVLQVPAKKQMKAVVEEVLKVPVLKQYKAVKEEVLRVPIKRHYKAVQEEVLKVPTRKNFKAVRAEIEKIPAKKTMKEVMKELSRRSSSYMSEGGAKVSQASEDMKISGLSTEQLKNPGNANYPSVKGKKRTGSALNDISRAKKSKDATSSSAARRADARTRANCARGKPEKDRAIEVNLIDPTNEKMSHDQSCGEKRVKPLVETRQIRTEISSFKHTERTCMRKRTNASEQLPSNTNGPSSPSKRQFGLAKTQLSLVNEIVEKGNCSPAPWVDNASVEQTPTKTLTFDDTVKLYEFTSPGYFQRVKSHPL